MGLFLKQSEQRSQLQSKIAADLTERLNKPAVQAAKPRPAILDNQQPTSSHAWVWVVLALVAAIGLVIVLVR